MYFKWAGKCFEWGEAPSVSAKEAVRCLDSVTVRTVFAHLFDGGCSVDELEKQTGLYRHAVEEAVNELDSYKMVKNKDGKVTLTKFGYSVHEMLNAFPS